MNKLQRRASAGGKARARQERIEAVSRFNTKPHYCRHCGEPIEVGNRRIADVINKKFCDNSCAASYNNARRVDNFITLA